MRTLALLAFFAALPAAGYAQHSSTDLAAVQQTVDGFKAIQSWRIDEARELAQRALKKDPKNPLTLALVAEVKMNMSDYEGAVAYFNKAKAAGAPAQVLQELIAAQAALTATKGYQEHVSDHFIVRHTPGKDAILVPYALETLEKGMERIGALLGWRPKSRIVVEFYPSPSTLAAVSSLTRKEIETSGTIALCRWNRLMVTTPRAVVFGYAWRDTISHELVHLIIGGASKNTVPIWLHEGLAKYIESVWRGEPGQGISVDQQERLRKAARSNKLIPFSRMHPSMAKLKSQEETSLAFAEVFTFIEFLVAQKGWEAIREVLQRMSRGASDAEAIEAVFGAPLRTLEKRWKKSLKTRPIKTKPSHLPVKGERKLVLKDRPDSPDDKLHGLTKKGRRFARAADLLYARGRLKAAQRELEKAYKETGSSLISGKLAMIALATGDLEAAEKAARAAIDGTIDLAGPNVTLAEILVRRKKPEEAKAPLERAIDINPFDPRIHQLTLQVLGEEGDPAKRKAAALALGFLGRPSRQLPSLGTGGLVQINGPAFSRIFVRPQEGDRMIPSGMTTPSAPISLAPGTYELELVPPKGAPQKHTMEVSPHEKGPAQRIQPGASGS